MAEITPTAFKSIGWKYYLVYVCTNLCTLTFVYLLLPETRDRTLEDIDAFFLSAKNPLQPVKIAKTMPVGIAEDYNLAEKVDPSKAEQVENTA